MSFEINHTHDAKARSWVESADRSGSDFPIQNLPHTVFRRRQSAEVWRGGIAIGDEVVDLAVLSRKGLLEGLAATATAACAQSTLNAFFEMGPSAWQVVRHGLFRLLSLDANAEQQRAIAECLVPQNGVEHAVPVQIGDYSDYYTSVYHAVTIGRLAGLDTATPNFKWIPSRLSRPGFEHRCQRPEVPPATRPDEGA